MLGYAITSMETETYRPSRLILLGEDATPQARRSTSLDALVTLGRRRSSCGAPQRTSTSPEHTYRFAAALAANGVPHATDVFAHGPHSLGRPKAQGTRRLGQR